MKTEPIPNGRSTPVVPRRHSRAFLLTIAILTTLHPEQTLLAQGQSGKAGAGGASTAGSGELFSINFAEVPLGAPPKEIRVLGGKLEVVEKDGTRMLRSSTQASFLFQVSEKIPNRFTLEFDLVPKFSGDTRTTALSFEGTREITQSDDSAHVLWNHHQVVVLGGGTGYADSRVVLPLDLKEEVIGNLTQVRAEFDENSLSLFTNGQQIYDGKRAKFVRGRVVRVSLGGQDEGDNAVYLARLRMTAGGGGGTAQQQGGTGATSNEMTDPAQDTHTASPVEAQSITGIAVNFDAAGVATVTWNPLSVAATYQVLRWNAGDPTCCNNMSPPGMPLQTAAWRDGVLPVAGTYAYRVIAKTADGLIAGETQIAYRGAATSPAGIAATTIPTAGVPTIAPGPVTTISSTYMTPGRLAAIAPPPEGTPESDSFSKFPPPPPSNDLPTLEDSVPADSTTAIPTVSVPTIAPEPVTTASSTYMTPGKIAALTPTSGTTTGDSNVSVFSPPLSPDLPTLEEAVPLPGTTSSDGTAQTGTIVTAEPAPYSSGPRTVSAVDGTTGVSSVAEAPFTVTVTMGVTAPVVTWTAAPNATGYIVSRSKIDDLNCCNTSSGRTFTATSPWQDQPLPTSGTYLYKVFASTPTGTIVAETQFGFRMPGDNTAVETPPVTAVLVDPTTTGTITPIAQPPTVTGVLVEPTTTGTITPISTTPTTATSGTVVTERAPTATSPTTPTVLSNGPAPTNLRTDADPGLLSLVRLRWDAVGDGTTKYKINRALAGTTDWTSLVTEDYPIVAGFPAEVPDPTKTYTYEVIAYQVDGRFGAATVDYHASAYEPTNFTATPIAPGQVRLEWDNLPFRFDPMFGEANNGNFFLSGPGTGTGISVVPSSTSAEERNSYTLTGVPAGSQTWTLTVDWTKWGIITPSTSWTKATATVAGVVAEPEPRYRLVALGFRALQQSKDIDDARDGHGDEIYLTAIANQTKLTGLPLPVTKPPSTPPTPAMTRTHGDEAVSVPYGRIKSGTASATGGIRSGDLVPASLDLTAPTGALQQLTFPIRIWEGDLGAPDDAVIVHLALWEDDVDPTVQAQWMTMVMQFVQSGYSAGPTWQNGENARGVGRTRKSIYAYTNPPYDHWSWQPPGQWGDDLNTCPPAVDEFSPFGLCQVDGVDRPIGASSVDRPPARWSERFFVLTRAIADEALAAGPSKGAHNTPVPAASPGTFRVEFLDDSVLASYPAANYELYLRLERVR